MFFFFAPVLVLFFQENGLTMTQIMVLQSVFSIAIVILEIPTGAVGDYFGKRLSLIVGSLCAFVGFTAYSMSAVFWQFLIAEIVIAIGFALMSGSDSAILHSSLKSLNKEYLYKKIEGKAGALQLTGILLGSFLGGYIASSSLRLTMIASALMAGITLVISLFFNEPEIIEDTSQSHVSYVEVIKSSIQLFQKNTMLLWLFLFVSTIGALAHLLHWIYQPYMVSVKLPVIYFGWAYMALGLISVMASRGADYIDKKLGGMRTLGVLVILVISSPLILPFVNSIYGIGALIFHQIFLGLSPVIFNDRVLKIIPAERAATVLSINNLGKRLIYSALGPILGYSLDVISLQMTLFILSVIVTISAFFFFVLRPHSNN